MHEQLLELSDALGDIEQVLIRCWWPVNIREDVKGGVKTYQRGVDVQRLCQGNGPAIMSVVAVSSQ